MRSPHIEYTGSTDLIFFETFKSDHYADVSLNQWLRHTPPELVKAHLRIDDATLQAIPQDKAIVLPQ